MVKVADASKIKKVESVLLISMIVISSIVILVSVTTPEVKAVDHNIGGAMFEDLMGPPYDMNPTMGIVEWDPNVDHIITGNYIIDPGMTLNIPALNYVNDRGTQNEIWFNTTGGGMSMDVYGTLITNTDPNPMTKTAFFGPELGGVWNGIYFHGGSQGVIQDSLIDGCINGVVFEPGSRLMAPGISDSRFQNLYGYGLQMDGAADYTNIASTNFDDTLGLSTGLSVSNVVMNITNSQFSSHGSDQNSLYVSNADVTADQLTFWGNNQPGDMVYIEGDSNGTSFSDCNFLAGAADYNYVRVNGSSIFMDNCSFDTSSGQLSVIATETATEPAHAVLINPTGDGTPDFFDDSFDNSTLNAIGSSSITLKWYLNVYAQDPDGNPISNAPVQIKDTLGNPSQPPTKITDGTGWARWFVCTELIKYAASTTNLNPFNISAENNSMLGYAIPEETIDMSKTSTVIVPFNPIPNTLPSVSFLVLVPPGAQSGLVTIDFMLSDPDPGDDGNLSMEVYFSTDNSTWYPATIAPTSDPTTNLNNDTLYVFVWDSAAINDLPGIYNETVQIKILPSDKQGPGTPGITGTFIVDNSPAPPPSPPMDITAMLSPLAPENVEIIWDASPDDGAGDFDVVGYTVYKSSSGINGSYNFEAWITANGSGPYIWIDLGAGDGDWNNYFYLVRANDTLDNEEQNTDKVGKFVNYLELNWNLFSVPLIQSNTSQQHVLRTIEGNYEILQGYHAGKSRPWLNSHIKKPKQFNDIIDIDHEKGYYIKMTTSDYLVVAGPVPNGVQISLKAGWNLVGYPCLESKTVSEALLSISGSYNKVEFYNTTTGKEQGLGPNDLMHPGLGYWIHATADCVWEVPL